MRTRGRPNHRRHECRSHRAILTSRSPPRVAARDRLGSVPAFLRSVAFPGKTAVTVDKPRFLISDLCSLLGTYLSAEQVREVYRAYLFGTEAHEGQWRKSGEPITPSRSPASWRRCAWITSASWPPCSTT